MSKVLITGGAGFIGYHLAKKLVSENHQVDIVDNFSRGVKDDDLNKLKESKKFNVINLDLENTESVIKLDKDYSNIYHLAAIVGVKHVYSDPYKVLDANFLLLKNVISLARMQKEIKCLIFASTSEVYASTLLDYGIDFPTKEDTKISIGNDYKKRSTYMLSKLYGEAMCFHSGLPFIIIRPHNFYGPRMGMSHVIPELIQKIKKSEGNKLEIKSGNHIRTFCYIDDAINMIIKLVEDKMAIGNIFNIGNSKNEITIFDLAKKIKKILNKKIELVSMPDVALGPYRRCPSTRKIEAIIGDTTQLNLDEGIKRCFEWYTKEIESNKSISAI